MVHCVGRQLALFQGFQLGGICLDGGWAGGHHNL